MRARAVLGVALAVCLPFVGGACGGSDDRRTLTWLGTVPSPQDPATMFMPSIDTAVHRALYAIALDERGRVRDPVPDLADGPPRVLDGGRTVSVRLRGGVRFAPPVDRAVTSRDVRYAVERGFRPNVASGAAILFEDVVGAEAVKTGRARRLAGIGTPDDRTVVFRLRRPRGALLSRRLSVSLTAPVPEEYARRFDAAVPSSYAAHAVGTGPYMFERDGAGRIAPKAGRLSLVPNPNWRAETDFRPRPLDRVLWRRVSDPDLAARQTVARRSTVCVCPLRPTTATRLAAARRERLASVPVPLVNVLTLNTRVAPFDRLDVRRAVMAGIDRVAYLRAAGGTTTGRVAGTLIPPGVLGHTEASADPLPGVSGETAPARSVLNGAAEARYRGPVRMAVVDAPAPAVLAEVLRSQLSRLGIRVAPRVLQGQAAYRACSSPSSRIGICVQSLSAPDSDPESFLVPAFSGDRILPRDNPNFAQLDDPQVDQLLARAVATTDARARARAWAAATRSILDRAVAIPLVYARITGVRSHDVSGLVSPATGFFDLAWMRAP